MIRVSVAEAKNRLSELLVRVGAGEEISVTRYGKPVARLVAVAPSDDLDAQRSRVQKAFRRLTQLRKQVSLDGDTKAIARDGLD